jgi:5-oxoprolinase (ATP-hydrolysing) subunit A
MRRIDLNCDMGEIPELIANGTQEALMPFLTSVNIACGGHAGDDSTMRATIEQARRWNLALGAHPGYPDRKNFGRLELEMPDDAVAATVFEQVAAFARIAEEMGASVMHVKPHGALYNSAVNDAGLAKAIAEGVSRWSREVILVGLAGSPMLAVFKAAGFRVAAEAFADRRYEADGTLRSRRFGDSLITDPELAAKQVIQIVERGMVTAVDGTEVPLTAETICIHGDNPGAVPIAAAVAKAIGLR